MKSVRLKRIDNWLDEVKMVMFRESSTYVSLPRMRLFFGKSCGSGNFFLLLEDESTEFKVCLCIFSLGVYFTYDKQRRGIKTWVFTINLLIHFYGDCSETTFSLSLGLVRFLFFVLFRIKWWLVRIRIVKMVELKSAFH